MISGLSYVNAVCGSDERLNEHEEHCNKETVQTGGLCNCLSEKHGGHDVTLCSGVTSYCGSTVSCSDTLADTGADTCDNGKSCTYSGTTVYKVLIEFHIIFLR